ncbi:putative metabolite transporter C2H8.02 [Termitomyces sp. J132]|nr:putative metabolite transporter C2H8.02 [Termitomyces sp. J132]
MLTSSEFKLLGIAGVGFFLDAYDLFVINPVATMLQYRLYGGHSLPANLEGFVKAGANIGSVIGQFLFGYLADALGRKAIYGKELMLIIFATILTMTTPTGSLSPNQCLIYLGIFRIILGIGVGGDYPMSASVTSDRSNLRKRGTMLAYIFSNQGWGSLLGSVVTIIVLACYKHVMDVEGKTSKVDGVWRIVIGVSLIPAFGTLYQRLTLPESNRFIASQKLKNATSAAEEATSPSTKKETEKDSKHLTDSPTSTVANDEPSQDNEKEKENGRSHFRDFVIYFSEWRHAKILIGTCVCWFLLDVAFYGINLNQNVVLQQIGYDGKTGTAWHRMFKISTGNIIITALGFVPGYWVSVLTIEIMGRKWIQIQGFLLAALFLAVLAGKFTTLSTAGFIVCFAFLQVRYFLPLPLISLVIRRAELTTHPRSSSSTGAQILPHTVTPPKALFPTRYRATAHGLSAAFGKLGAIVSALAFNTLTKKIGTPAVLWIFFGCCIAGAGFTLLLPEVKGRDPDLVLAEEMREAREQLPG